MASTRAPSTWAAPQGTSAAHERAFAWTQAFCGQFARMALFYIEGTSAQLIGSQGAGTQNNTPPLSLIEQTPLRWTLEAAVPIIGAGRAPGGASVARHLGLTVPRSYAVLPYVHSGRLVALVYLDHAHQPLPMDALAPLLGALSAKPLLLSQPIPKRRRRSFLRQPQVRRRRQGTVVPHSAPCFVAPLETSVGAAAEAARGGSFVEEFEQPSSMGRQAPPVVPTTILPPEPDETDKLSVAVDLNTAPTVSAAVAPTAPVLPHVFDAPLPQLPVEHIALAAAPAQRRRWPWRLLLAGFLAAGGAAAWLLHPPHREPGLMHVEVTPKLPLASIARRLQNQGVISNAQMFQLWARASRLDRHVRAGIYDIPGNLWPWTVLQILHRGQVQTIQITIPEGLTLVETAKLLENNKILSGADFLLAARSPQFLRRYKLEGGSAEGFLFPETYRVVRGVSGRDMADAMVRQFFRRVGPLISGQNLSPQAIYDRVILASLVERETRDKGELATVAGVFMNRLEHDMRLESCASIQYVLGRTKEHLQLDDIRAPSPYNTYLHPGLPPGPIANPGLAALKAAFAPEKHDYLFFFARDDGTHQHFFSKTFTEHQKAHRSFGRKLSAQH